MPLLDQFGQPLTPPKSVRPPKRPKNKPRVKRVPSYQGSSRQVDVSRRNLAPVTHVELMLAAKHNINGTIYGPGRVVVTLDVAPVLREGERRAAWTDANFAGSRSCVIGPGRTKGALGVTEVAPEYFDMRVDNGVPFGVVDRHTGQFQAY